MGNKVNEQITTLYYHGGTGYTDITLTVYDETQTATALGGVMSEITGTGFYYKAWTPDAVGVWGVTVKKGSTALDGFVYHIEIVQEGSADDVTTDTIHGKIGTDIEMADRSLFDLLVGGGPVSFPTAAAPTNNISLGAVLRAIYNDSDEIQAELADGGRTDLLIDAIKAVTDIIKDTADAGYDRETDSLEAIRDYLSTMLAHATYGLSALDTELGTIRQKATGPSWNQDTDSLEAIRETIDTNDTSVDSQLDTIDGFHDVPAKDATTDAQMRDVLGKKDDTQQTTIDTTRSLMAYIKGLLSRVDTTVSSRQADWGAVAGTKTNIDTAAGDTPYIADAALPNPPTANSLARILLAYLADGDGSIPPGGTVLPNNTSLYQILGTEFLSSLNLYDALVTGYTTAATATAVGSILERLQLLQIAGILNNTIYTIDSATVNTVTDAALSATNDIYNGGLLVPISGTQVGQARVIYDYDGTGKVLYVTPDWTSAPSTDNYVIIPNGLATYLTDRGKGQDAIFDIVDAIPIKTRVADATTTDGTVQTLFTIGSPGGLVHVSEIDFDLTNMVAGDSVRIKFAKRMKTLGNMITVVDETYIGPQDPAGMVFSEDELGTNLFGFILTIERLAGGDREYAWELFYEG